MADRNSSRVSGTVLNDPSKQLVNIVTPGLCTPLVVMRQATNLRDLELPMLLPGVKVTTSPTDYYAVQQSQLMRFDGKRWVRFGDLVYDE